MNTMIVGIIVEILVEFSPCSEFCHHIRIGMSGVDDAAKLDLPLKQRYCIKLAHATPKLITTF